MEECECAICKNNIQTNNLCKTTCNHMYCLSCLLLHLKNDNRCPLCRANIEDSESSDESDSVEETPHLYRYEINGIISVNYNLKVLIYIFIISIQYNIIMLIISLNNSNK